MSYGDGSITFVNNTKPSTPATVTGADNGLTMNGTIVEMGGDLIKDTGIDLSGFVYEITSGGNVVFSLTENIYKLGDIDNIGKGVNLFIYSGIGADEAEQAAIGDSNETWLYLDGNPNTRLFVLGPSEGNKTKLAIDDNSETVKVLNDSNPYLIIDVSGGQYLFGDFFGAQNASAAYIELQGNISNNFMAVRSAAVGAPYYLLIDIENGIYYLGNISTATNNTFLQIDDANQVISFKKATDNYLLIDIVNDVYFFGNSSGVGNYNSTNGTVKIGDTALVPSGPNLSIDSAFGTLIWGQGFDFYFASTESGIATRNVAGTGNSVPWRFGSIVTATSTLDTTQYLQVNVQGTTYNLALAT